MALIMKPFLTAVVSIAGALLLISSTGCLSQPSPGSAGSAGSPVRGDPAPFEDTDTRTRVYTRSDELPRLELQPEPGQIVFSTVPPEAEVVINGEKAGKSPLRAQLSDGSYRIRISKERYRPFDFYLDIQADNIAAVQVQLQPYTGLIDPRLFPQDAAVRIAGTPVDEFPIELPIGTYTMRAERFGYAALSRKVEVRRGETVRPQFELPAAAFAVETVSVVPKTLRYIPPLPPPALQIKGLVSAPGTIEIQVYDNFGRLFRSEQIKLQNAPGFNTSIQLPEGIYRIQIRARGKDAPESETVTYEKQVEVRAENTVALFSTGTPSAAAPLGVPRSQSLPTGVLQSGLSFSGGGAASEHLGLFPAQISLTAGLPYALEFQGSAGFIIHRQEPVDWSGTAQLKKEIAAAGTGIEYSSAVQIMAGYTSEGTSESLTPLLPFHSFIGIGPILELRYAPQTERILGISLSPTVEWRLEAEKQQRWSGQLHSAVFAQTGQWAYALSAKFDSDTARLWYGTEFSRLIPATSMHINLSAGAVCEDDFIDYYTGGIGFYYIR